MRNESRRRRRSIRLPSYDYSQAGAYFITICTQNRARLFGEVVREEMRLSAAGTMVYKQWTSLSERFPGIRADDVVVMPDHIHGIIQIREPVIARDSVRVADGVDGVVDGVVVVVDGVDGVVDGVGAPPVGALDIAADVPGDGPDQPVPTAIGRMVGAFKSCSTNAYIRGVKRDGWMPFHTRLWQRNYYERVIRDEKALQRIRQYMEDNPRRWFWDHDDRPLTRDGYAP